MSATNTLRLWRRRAITGFRRHILGFRGVHPTSFIAPGSTVHHSIIMGEHAFMNRGCVVGPRVRLGRYVMFGPQVAVVGGDHRFDVAGTPIIFADRPEMPETVIEDDVWVGFRAVVIAGVRIGRGAIIAAGSVVTKDVPPFEIHAGVPNRKVRDRFQSAEELEQHKTMLEGKLVSGDYCRPKLQT